MYTKADPDVTVNTFNDFLKYINEFEEINDDDKKTFRAVYRGVQEKGEAPYLVPSLEWNGLTQYESELIKEMKRLKPKTFSLPQLELIEVLRHYTLPTRLLDFSLSAFVALYFAVTMPKDEKVDKTGNTRHRIYCMKVRENNLYAETIARVSQMESFEYYVDKSRDNKPIEKVLFSMEKDEGDKKDKIKSFLKNMFSGRTSAVFTYPQTYTEREENQQSIFMIFCNDIYDSIGKTTFSKDKSIIDNIDNENIILDRFYFKANLFNPFSQLKRSDYKIIDISPSVVTDFKKQLNMMGITEAYLFPDNLEHMAKQTVDKISSIYGIKHEKQ